MNQPMIAHDAVLPTVEMSRWYNSNTANMNRYSSITRARCLLPVMVSDKAALYGAEGKVHSSLEEDGAAVLMRDKYASVYGDDGESEGSQEAWKGDALYARCMYNHELARRRHVAVIY